MKAAADAFQEYAAKVVIAILIALLLWVGASVASLRETVSRQDERLAALSTGMSKMVTTSDLGVVELRLEGVERRLSQHEESTQKIHQEISGVRR